MTPIFKWISTSHLKYSPKNACLLETLSMDKTMQYVEDICFVCCATCENVIDGVHSMK